jgi:signal transduction histidine kinase
VKIKTQARLLVASIVAVPLFIILAQIAYRQFISNDVVSGLPEFDDVSTLVEEHISLEHWDSISRNVVRFRQFGDVVILRNDFLVLYSEIPDFRPDVFTSWENILPLFENQRIIFTSIGLDENHGYIIVRIRTQSIKDRLFPFFVHALVGIIIISMLIILAVCMSIVITRTIARSVQVLENATRRIAEGELDLNVDVKGSNEITSLTNSLNKMRYALKEDELRRSRFIMGITHDLKTPLALIKGYAEAIEDGVAEDPVSRSNAAEIINAKADQLEGMVNDLIDFVRMETGEWRAQLDYINLTDFLEKRIKSFNADFSLLDHTLVHDISLPKNISIPMDERLLLRAFENLISNAVRHTPKGSIICLKALKTCNAVELSISDNGPGIDEEALPHVFEMFYRGSSSRREKGMGLGLAVVKWVVDYHGWSISASTGGEGTCFTITIPL